MVAQCKRLQLINEQGRTVYTASKLLGAEHLEFGSTSLTKVSKDVDRPIPKHRSDLISTQRNRWFKINIRDPSQHFLRSRKDLWRRNRADAANLTVKDDQRWNVGRLVLKRIGVAL
jgi:hypothetical protein